MRAETRVAVEACVEALNTEYTAEERDRAVRPPYPVPDRLVRNRDVMLAEVERLRQAGQGDRTCVFAMRDTWAGPWETATNRLHGSTPNDAFRAALPLLFTASDMSAAEFAAVISRVPGATHRNHLRAQLVQALLDAGEVAEAERAADTFESDHAYLGHRRIALWFARRGDAAGFFARWSRLAATKDRHHLGVLKQTLVESVTRVSGWQEAIAVIADKRLGPTNRRHAFAPLAEAGEVEELRTLFAAGPGAGLLDPLEELGLLSDALYHQARRTGKATAEPFTEIFNRILAIDYTQKPSMRHRDGMLLRLWPAYPDADTLALARKSARSPAIKRELKTLHPDVIRPARLHGT
jgi:hypothetical protein